MKIPPINPPGNILRVKPPSEDVSSTTLKQWRSKIIVKTIEELNCRWEKNGKTRKIWNPQLNHPTMRGIKAFFARVDRAQKKGLVAVLELQQELKLEDTNGKKN